MKRFAFLLILISFAFLSAKAAASEPVPHGAQGTEDEIHEIAEEATHDPHAAAGDHGGGHQASVIEAPKAGIAPMITAIVVFMIVAGILAVGVWPKIVAGLDERNEKIQGEIAAAEAARKQAKDALNEYEKNLADARAEAQQMLADTKAQQGELAAQLKATAETELSAMREKAKAEIEAAKKQALNELYSESVNLATVMAGKILQREVTANDQQRLMEESLHEMKTAKS